jgi:hypothetical protein
MPQYHIDEMQGDELLAVHVAIGDTPMEAVGKVTAGPFVVRTSQKHWFRVVDERQSQVFKFAHADGVRPR